jgi:hypothetical protein
MTGEKKQSPEKQVRNDKSDGFPTQLAGNGSPQPEPDLITFANTPKAHSNFQDERRKNIMATAAIRDLCESIRPAQPQETGFVGTIRRHSAQCPATLQVLRHRVLIMMILATFFILGVYSADGQESILYSFGAPGCVAQPDDAPVFDSKGNIYGTCLGPQRNGGYVYELSPASGGGWTWQNIFPFDNIGDNTTGDQPNGLAIDSKGNLYGTTSQGEPTTPESSLSSPTARVAGLKPSSITSARAKAMMELRLSAVSSSTPPATSMALPLLADPISALARPTSCL